MAKILLAAHPTAGHTNALRAIGKELKNKGHNVGISIMKAQIPFAGYWPDQIKDAATLAQKIAEDDIEILPLGCSPASFWYGIQLPLAKGMKELGLALRLFTSGLKNQSKSIAEHVQNWGADVVVGDYLMPGAMLGAKLSKRPYAAFYHSALPFPVKNAPPFGSGLKDVSPDSREWVNAKKKQTELFSFFDNRVIRVAKDLGISFERESLLDSPISDDLNLLATTPELEPGLYPLKGPVVMTGPCLPDSNETIRNDPALMALKENSFKIYLSLGTVFNGQPHIYNAIIEGLSDFDAQLIVSAGASLNKLSHWSSSDRHIFKRVPQVALLPKVDVVITHGGNNTVQETLFAGKPMIVVPFGGDQLVNAQRVERLGAGVSVLPENLNSETISRAIRIVTRRKMSEKARSIGQSLQKYNGTKTAVEQILDLAKNQQIY